MRWIVAVASSSNTTSRSLITIRVAGDLSSYSHTANGKPVPGMAAPAKQAGTFICKDVAAIVAEKPRPTFNYFDFGSVDALDRARLSPIYGASGLPMKSTGSYGPSSTWC